MLFFHGLRHRLTVIHQLYHAHGGGPLQSGHPECDRLLCGRFIGLLVSAAGGEGRQYH